jgi:O-antigen/teichoic acid export membrane protein
MSLWRAVTGTAVAKILVMGLGGVLGIIGSKIIIGQFGVEAYAQYGLLTGLRNLLPFADLGIGAVVLNAVAGSGDPRRDENVRRTITSAFRILTVSGVVVALTAVVVQLFGWWPVLLGNGLTAGGDLMATLCLAIFGLSLPLGMGTRILIGTGRNAMQTVLAGLVSPVFLAGVLALTLLGSAAGDYVAVVSYLAATLTSTLTLAVAARLISPQVGRAARDVPRVRRVPGVPVAAVAVPMLIQSVATPVALASDRLLISQRADADTLAEYVLASQFFGIVLQTVFAAGVTLWPHLARARSRGEIVDPLRLTVPFVAGTTVLLGLLVAVIQPLAGFVGGDEITLGVPVIVSYAVLVLVQALNYPPGMYMTDERGLKFQVVPCLLMCVSNVALSWALIPTLGAAGPLVGSAVAIFVFQVVPNHVWVRRDVVRRRAAAAEISA